jgi:signal transduction histidine kinase/ActR/RegA family two-component response regulator
MGNARSLALGAAAVAVGVAALVWPAWLDSTGFMPHGHCYLWRGPLVALHLGSDLLIGVSYTAISLTLAYLVYRTRGAIPFHWMILAFGTFIIACGATHFMEVWTLWRPDYWLSGDVKLLTAAASVATAIALPPLVPRALALVRADQIAASRKLELDERAELLMQAQSARADAEAANRAKDQFLAVVSHELRTPLSPILAWSRMLRAGSLDAASARRALEVIERNASAQAQLIEDLLDVSRIVSGKLRLEVRPVELVPVIEAAMEASRPAAEAKSLRLQTILDPQTGAVSGDPQRLQQIVWNLLSNAIKFTPKGGFVRVTLQRVDSHAEISVADSGQGIGRAAIPHLFERFWQADSGADRRHGGLGLGLAIVRHLCELHGGSVTADSAGPGQGSEFRVSLPLRSVTAVVAIRDRRHPRASDGPHTGEMARIPGTRVLVVDDEPDSNEAVTAVLVACGAEVRVAASAAQALHILDSWVPDVLVSDVGMPDIDGYALIAQLRARPRERGGAIPAVALTAYARADDRVKALASGFQMHVAKPVDPVELTVVVASLTGPR